MDASDPIPHVMVYGPTALEDVAGVEHPAEPVTPEVPSVSEFTNPVMLAVSGGFATP